MQEDGHVKLEELGPDQTSSESEECGDDDTDDRKVGSPESTEQNEDG